MHRLLIPVRSGGERLGGSRGRTRLVRRRRRAERREGRARAQIWAGACVRKVLLLMRTLVRPVCGV